MSRDSTSLRHSTHLLAFLGVLVALTGTDRETLREKWWPPMKWFAAEDKETVDEECFYRGDVVLTTGGQPLLFVSDALYIRFTTGRTKSAIRFQLLPGPTPNGVQAEVALRDLARPRFIWSSTPSQSRVILHELHPRSDGRWSEPITLTLPSPEIVPEVVQVGEWDGTGFYTLVELRSMHAEESGHQAEIGLQKFEGVYDERRADPSVRRDVVVLQVPIEVVGPGGGAPQHLDERCPSGERFVARAAWRCRS